MNEDFDVKVLDAAVKVVQDEERRIRRKKINLILKQTAVIFVTGASVVYVLKKYNEEPDSTESIEEN